MGKGNLRRSPAPRFFANRYPNDIVIADINKDGNPDLGIANTEVSFLTVLLGDGKGQFKQAPKSPFIVHSRPHTHGIAAGILMMMETWTWPLIAGVLIKCLQYSEMAKVILEARLFIMLVNVRIRD